MLRCCTVGVFLVAAFLSLPLHAQLSKAHLILLDRGLQIQGMVQPDDHFNLTTYSNANYTSLNSLPAYESATASWSNMWRLGDAPGFAWGRWVQHSSLMPPLGNEADYTNQLVTLSYSDEANLYDSGIYDTMVNWFNATSNQWPHTIRYFNSWGGQIDDALLSSFISDAQPDLISFDTYPWKSVYDENEPDSTGPAIGGALAAINWYGELRRYRAWSSTYNIPFGIYRQTFAAVEPWSSTVYRHPSASELWVNTFAALAFNAKMLVDFTYNSGATSLFDRHQNPDGSTTGAGDNYPNALYAEQSEINLRARHLGKALVRLKPVHDLRNAANTNAPGPASSNPDFPDGYTTSIMFLRGKYIADGVTNFNPIVNSLLLDPDIQHFSPAGTGLTYTWWEPDKNDPYLRGFLLSNTGNKNDGLVGDVIISWFTPLDESFDGPIHSNQVYMMVVNGLTDPFGSPEDCAQQVKLNFLNTAATTSVIMLDPATGNLQTNALPVVNTRRQLVLDLNGGDAALFKFNTGAPFVGFHPPESPSVSATLETDAIAIQIQGTPGARYEVQSVSSLDNQEWTTRANIQLPSASHEFRDTLGEAMRYYRVSPVQP